MMVRDYIILAAGCVSLGIIITFIVLGLCQYLGVNIDENWWVVGIPVVLSLVINITFVEIYRKIRNR